MTVNHHPVGTPRKEPLPSNAKSSQAPQTDATLPNQEPHTPCGIDTMNTLIQTVILNNNWVRRLNSFRNMPRSDPREGPTILDDNVESTIPTLDTFLGIQSALCPPLPSTLGPHMPPSPQTPSWGPGPPT